MILLLVHGTTSTPQLASVDSADGCFVTGHTLTCHRSKNATHVLQNLAQVVTDVSLLSEIRVTESGLNHVPDQMWRDCPSLVSLDVSGNLINDFTPSIAHPNVQYLNLSYNGRLNHVDLAAVFKNLPSLLRIDLSHNEIMSVGKKSRLTEKQSTVILLTEANITCDKESSWFMELISSEIHLSPPRIIVDEARCKDGPLDGVALAQSHLSHYALTHPTCSLCDCSFKPSLHVNCSAKGLTQFPTSLPRQTKVVDLTHNRIATIRLYPDYGSVIYLHLENNTIESLTGLEGNAFAPNIRFLNLDTNRLTEVQAHFLKQLNVDRISLKNNPWTCDCDTIAFQLWIQDHSNIIPEMDQIRCAGPAKPGQENGLNADTGSEANPMLSGRTIYKILRSDLCPQPVVGAAYHIFDFLTITMAFLTVFIICKMVYDWWWQRRTGKLPRFFKINL